jgi:hypothetical protein
MMRRFFCLLPASVLLLGVTGCGSGTQVVPVSGTVTIDGKPLTKGYVRVMPANYRPATGAIGPDGKFTLTTKTPNDGCIIGTHPAVVLANEPLDAVSQKWHAPAKYADETKSGLSVTITGPNTDLKIELKWDGGKPYTEKFDNEGGTER